MPASPPCWLLSAEVNVEAEGGGKSKAGNCGWRNRQRSRESRVRNGGRRIDTRRQTGGAVRVKFLSVVGGTLKLGDTSNNNIDVFVPDSLLKFKTII